MESERYYQNIRNRLSQLVTEVRIDGSVNLHSLNILAEDFFVEFLNLLYDWKLKNANEDVQNAAGIDLIDRENKIIVQVSSTYDHQKIQSSLDKSDKPEYQGYHFYFVAITEKTPTYRSFHVPQRITFFKDTDILTVGTLMNMVLHAGIKKQKAISVLVDKYFYYESDGNKIENFYSNVQTISFNNSIIANNLTLSSIQSGNTESASKPFSPDLPNNASELTQLPNSEESEKEGLSSFDLSDKDILFSVGTKLAYEINAKYYRHTHYVWCAPLFHDLSQPPTSNPQTIYLRLLDIIYHEDKHTQEIDDKRTGIIKGAFAREKQGMINQTTRDGISFVVKTAERKEFHPIIYIIPVNKLKNPKTRCEKKPPAECASTISQEYLIEDLKEGEFYLIDLSESMNRIAPITGIKEVI